MTAVLLTYALTRLVLIVLWSVSPPGSVRAGGGRGRIATAGAHDFF